MPASSLMNHHHHHHNHNHHSSTTTTTTTTTATTAAAAAAAATNLAGSPIVEELTSQLSKQHLIEEAASLSAKNALAKTSQNITESVPVPSSEHVAEIVGRQGCKIKALRAKTNTYIKTPIRGETPMFVITGRKEDVLMAKREIQLAADHFSQIRARRGSNTSSTGGVGGIASVISSVHETSPKATSPKLILNSNAMSGASSLSSSASISPSNQTNQTIINTTTTESILTAKPQALTPAASVNNISLVRSNSTSPTNLNSADTFNLSSHAVKASSIQSTSGGGGGCGALVGGGVNGGGSGVAGAPMSLQPGQICKKVTVPYQVVGLVVGPKGSTIKRIQQNTNTYIVTPSRDSQPVFEIQGMLENVEAARIEIENYIMLRTNQQNNGLGIANPSSSSSSSSSSSASSSCSSNEFNSLNGLIIGSSENPTEYDDFNSQSIGNLFSNQTSSSLLSPKSTSLFQSVVNVVDEFIPSAGEQAAPTNSSSSSIWSASSLLNNSSTSSLSSTNKLCSIADDLLVNSLQQSLNTASMGINNAMMNKNGHMMNTNGGASQRSSSSSCSSSTSSSFSSSFCSNDATIGSSLITPSSYTTMLLNESSQSVGMTALYDFGLNTPTAVSDSHQFHPHPHQPQQQQQQQQHQQQVHLIAPSSNASTSNDILLNSLFQHEHSLLFSSLGNTNQPDSFINLTNSISQSQMQQQSEYNFYYFNNATNSIDAQNFI